MTVRAINREDNNICTMYTNAKSVDRIFTEEGNDAWQITLLTRETATFCTADWILEKMDWVRV